MGAGQSAYHKQMRKRYKMTAVWPPTNERKVGDYGTINKKLGTFTKVANIKDRGIKFEVEEDSSPGTYDKFVSIGTSETEVDANGKATNKTGKAAVGLKYSRAGMNSIMYHGNKPVQKQFKDGESVAKQIANLSKKNKFDLDYWIVYELREVEGLVVTIASKMSSSIILKGSANAIKSKKMASGEVSFGTKQNIEQEFNKTDKGAKCTPLVVFVKVRINPKTREPQISKPYTKTMKMDEEDDNENYDYVELGKNENGESYGIEYFSFTPATGESDEEEEEATTGKNDTA